MLVGINLIIQLYKDQLEYFLKNINTRISKNLILHIDNKISKRLALIFPFFLLINKSRNIPWLVYNLVDCLRCIWNSRYL